MMPRKMPLSGGPMNPQSSGGSPGANPILAATNREFGLERNIRSAVVKSGRVQRTSDIPQIPKIEKDMNAMDKSSRISRTSDIPKVGIGQGLQGNRHSIATGATLGGSGGSMGHGR